MPRQQYDIQASSLIPLPVSFLMEEIEENETSASGIKVLEGWPLIKCDPSVLSYSICSSLKLDHVHN